MITGITWDTEQHQYVGFDLAGCPHYDSVPEECDYRVRFANRLIIAKAAEAITRAVERARALQPECTCEADSHAACPACMVTIDSEFGDRIPWEG